MKKRWLLAIVITTLFYTKSNSQSNYSKIIGANFFDTGKEIVLTQKQKIILYSFLENRPGHPVLCTGSFEKVKLFSDTTNAKGCVNLFVKNVSKAVLFDESSYNILTVDSLSFLDNYTIASLKKTEQYAVILFTNKYPRQVKKLYKEILKKCSELKTEAYVIKLDE